jgi:hypothetical protein
MADFDPLQVASYGLDQNKNGGLYRRGCSYSIDRKLAVQNEYLRA